MAELDFVEEYLKLQPLADRETTIARTAAYTKAVADADENSGRILDLAHFAYELPPRHVDDPEAWFLEVFRVEDPAFSLKRGSGEAARIATLVLSERLSRADADTAILVHAAAFAGKRRTVDNNALSLQAKRTLQSLVRKRGAEVVKPTVQYLQTGVPDIIKKYGAENTELTDLQVFDAIHKDYIAQARHITSTANGAISKIWNEKSRLAEEIDLLWWHLGQHSFLLDIPLDEIPAAARPIVIGADLAAMVNVLPGPYGIYGIARRALGVDAEKPLKLSDAIKSIKPEYNGLLSKSNADHAIAPVHGALEDVLFEGAPVVATQFKKKTGITFDTRMSAYELAIQTYHEALLLKLDWFK